MPVCILITFLSIFLISQIHLGRTDGVIEYSQVTRLSLCIAFQLLNSWSSHTQGSLVVVLYRVHLGQCSGRATVIEHILVV